MNEAMLDRFPITLEQPYASRTTEKKILEKAGCDDKDFGDHLTKWAEIVRKAFTEGAVDEIISTRRLVDIVKANNIFNNKEKAIAFCLARFDEDTKEAFMSLYGKVDEQFNEFDAEHASSAASEVADDQKGALLIAAINLIPTEKTERSSRQSPNSKGIIKWLDTHKTIWFTRSSSRGTRRMHRRTGFGWWARQSEIGSTLRLLVQECFSLISHKNPMLFSKRLLQFVSYPVNDFSKVNQMTDTTQTTPSFSLSPRPKRTTSMPLCNMPMNVVSLWVKQRTRVQNFDWFLWRWRERFDSLITYDQVAASRGLFWFQRLQKQQTKYACASTDEHYHRSRCSRCYGSNHIIRVQGMLSLCREAVSRRSS